MYLYIKLKMIIHIILLYIPIIVFIVIIGFLKNVFKQKVSMLVINNYNSR